MKLSNLSVLRLPALATLLLAPALSAQAEVLVSRYNVSLNGIPAGDATLHTTFDAKHYEIKLSADVGTVLESTKIQGVATGERAGAAITPEHFQLAVSGGETGTVEVNFKGDAEGDVQINSRLRGVFDPLSAVLAASLKPQTAGANPCGNSVMPIFTGRARFDLSLHPKPYSEAQKEASDSPFMPKGDSDSDAPKAAKAKDPKERSIVACEADYAAMPGEPFQKIGMEIVFSKMAKPKFWLVERITLPTNKGTVIIERQETSTSAT
jgi:hypothetical protein